MDVAGQQSEQIGAGLLQQDVVVPFIRAVWVVVVPEVTQAVHCKEAAGFVSKCLCAAGSSPLPGNPKVLAGLTETRPSEAARP